MYDDKIFKEFIEENDSDIENNNTNSLIELESTFDERFKNLEIDIEHLEARMKDLQDRIIDLDTVISQIKSLLKNNVDPKRRLDLYKVMNFTNDLLVKFQDIYQKYLQVKFNYRKEQNSLTLNKNRFIRVELQINNSFSELTPQNLIKEIHNLTNAIASGKISSDDVNDSLIELETDINYKLD